MLSSWLTSALLRFETHSARRRAVVNRRGRAAVATLVSVAVVIVGAVPASALQGPAPTSSQQVVQAAQARGIALTRAQDASLLLGKPADVTLAIANTSGARLYNVSVRELLPAGVSYVPGSVQPSGLGAPAVIEGADDVTTLVWLNALDIAVGETIEVSYALSVDPAVLPVGSTFAPTAEIAASADPRQVPDLAADGTFVDNTDTSHRSADASSPTELTAIEVRKSEPSPEHERLRGVHDEATTYTLRVTSTSEGPTDDVVLVDYLPAGLEFLFCGEADNSSAPEYGSRSLTEVAPVNPGESLVAECLAPFSVETAVFSPGGAPEGVYTRVEWQLETLNPGEKREILYAAGIPQRANVAFGPGAPTPSSGEQGANLDNNSGAPTRETTTEQGLTNYAQVSGEYTGTVASGASRTVADSDSLTVTAEDLAIHKTVNDTSFAANATVDYELTVRTGEYASARDIVLVDTLPDGLCPVDHDATAAPTSCANSGTISVLVNGVGTLPVAFEQHTDGTHTLTFPAVMLAAEDSMVVAIRAAMRPNYLGTTAPTVSGDYFTNHVALTGETVDAAGVNPPLAGAQRVLDESSAYLASDAPSLTKTIKPDATPYACGTDTADYVEPGAGDDVTFSEGSTVCFLVTARFSDVNQTKNVVVTDHLPQHLTYVGHEVLNGPVARFAVVGHALEWSLGAAGAYDDAFVPAGSVFQVVVEAVVGQPAAGWEPDLTENLAKMRWESTAGAVRSTRDAVNLAVETAPPVSITKTAEINGVTASQVRAGDVVDYTVTVTNDGDRTVENLDVWDVLPAGVAAADVSAVSDAGVITDPGAPAHPSFAQRDTLSSIRWESAASLAPEASRTFTYVVTIPDDARVSTVYTNVAHVSAYQSRTNQDALVTHRPAENVDTAVLASEIDALVASASTTVNVPGVALTKGVVTDIAESGNDAASQAVVGETLTYTVDVTIPARTTVYHGTLGDIVPVGIQIVAAQVSTSFSTDGGGSFTTSLPAGAQTTVDAANNSVSVSLGATYQNASDEPHVLRLVIPSVVTTDPENTDSRSRLNNAEFRSWPTPVQSGPSLPVLRAAASITVVEPSAIVIKGASRSTNVRPGDKVTFTVTARNENGRPPLHDSVLIDCIPAGFENAALAPGSPSTAVTFDTASSECAGGTLLTWEVGSPGDRTLDPGEHAVVLYEAWVVKEPAAGVVLTNTAELFGSTLDDGQRNSAVERVVSGDDDATVRLVQASIAKTADRTSATIGQSIAYQAAVTVPAGTQLFDATVEDTLPAGLDPASLRDVSITSSNAAVDAGAIARSTDGGQITWALGDLPASAGNYTVTFRYTLTVADDTVNARRGTVLRNGVALTWNTVNDDATTNQTVPPATVDVRVVEPALAIDKAVSNAAPQPGERFTYTVAVSPQTGVSDRSSAYSVTVVDTLPAGVLPTSINQSGSFDGANHRITWTIPGPVTSAVNLTYEAILESPTPAAAQVNTADIVSYRSLPSAGRTYAGPEDTATVTPSLPKVTVVKEFRDAVAYREESAPWRITVTGASAATAHNITIVDTLPNDWTYDAGSARVSVAGAEATQAEPTAAGQALTWTNIADTLAQGETIVIDLTATPSDSAGASSGFPHRNAVVVTAHDAAGQTGPAGTPGGYGDDDDAVALIHVADLRVQKSHTGTPVAGTPFTWTVNVDNLPGADPAVGPFTVTDTLPAVLGDVVPSFSGTGWACTATAGELRCTHAQTQLAAGDALPELTVSAVLPSGLAEDEKLENTATVAGRTLESVLANNTATDVAFTATEADVAIVKTGPTGLVAGQTAAYALTVTNNGPSVARGVTVTDALPIGLAFVSAAGAGWGCTEYAGTVTCTRAAVLAVGQTAAIDLRVAVAADLTVVNVVNTATVTTTTDDPEPDNDDSTVTTPLTTSADVAIAKQAVGDVLAGEEAVYRLTVLNHGPSVAQPGTVVTDVLPSGLTFQSARSGSGSWTCVAAGQEVTCTLGSELAPDLSGTAEVDAGASAVVDLTVAVSSTLGDVDGAVDVTNTATITDTTTTDPNPSNDEDTTDTDVVGRADLAVAKSHPTGTVIAGESIEFTLAVSNNGPADTPGPLSLTDVMPAGMRATAASGAGWDCTVVDDGAGVACERTAGLASGVAAADVTVVADVAPSAGSTAGTVLTNTATVDGPLTDPVPANNTTTDAVLVTDRATVAITKTVRGDDTRRAGTDLTFDLVVTNAGPSDADDVTIRDVLPPRLSLVSATGADCLGAAGATEVACDLGVLEAGASVTVVVEATVASGVADGTQVTNVASVATTTPDDPSDNEDDATVTVVASADLALSKEHETGRAVAGEQTTFVLSVRNDGPSDAVGPLQVVDTLPDGMTFVSAQGAGWDCRATGHEVTCATPDGVFAGAAAPELVLTVQLDAAAPAGALRNTAVVSSATTDPEPGNNEDAERIDVSRVADLRVAKAHVEDGRVGQPLPFTLTVTNGGPSTAEDVVLRDLLPTGLTLVDVTGPGWSCEPSGTTVSCTLDGPLAPSQVAPLVTVMTEVTAKAYPRVTNVAKVSTATPDPVPDNDTARDDVVVEPTSDLRLTKSLVGELQAGEEAVYRLVVENQGPTADPGPITVIDDLPEGLEYVRASGEAWECDAQAQVVTCITGGLDVGQRAAVELTVAVAKDAPEEISNRASVTSDTTDVDPRNNADVATGGVEAPAEVPDTLPRTGAAILAAAGLAAILMLAGVALVLRGRRRA